MWKFQSLTLSGLQYSGTVVRGNMTVQGKRPAIKVSLLHERAILASQKVTEPGLSI